MISVRPIKAFSDNYIWLLQRRDTPWCAVVDPGDAAPVLDVLAAEGLRLEAILVTHHHGDHVGGVERLLRDRPVPVFGPAGERIPGRSHALAEGDVAELPELGLRLAVLDVPGHTAGHIAFHGHGMLFCGDTLFAGGCGRLFEGTAEQMHASLGKLAALAPDTAMYCGHEYTQANLRFARRVDPDNRRLRERLEKVDRQRAAGECTLPASIAEERETNPFLRSADAGVKAGAEALCGRELHSPVEVFAAVRALKDAA